MKDLALTLQELSVYGRPSLSQMRKGTWYCRIDMHVVAEGATFEVASDIEAHGTPTAAADECLQRVAKIMQGFSASANKVITHG